MDYKSVLIAVFLLLGEYAFADLEWNKTESEVTVKPADASASARFDFVNSGNTEIRIVKIATSCGCTFARANKEVFLPGEKGVIAVAYTVGDESGIRKETISLELAGSTQKTAALVLKITIPSLITLTPNRLVWTADEPPIAKELKAVVAKDVPLHLLRATTSDARLNVRLADGASPGQYLVTITPKTSGELIRSVVTLESDFPRAKPRKFSVYVWVR